MLPASTGSGGVVARVAGRPLLQLADRVVPGGVHALANEALGRDRRSLRGLRGPEALDRDGHDNARTSGLAVVG
ncbi:unannotated protein [freshwater metagenome]|uniref:Unannotated protein n=1 Tax=freshwater metagenome TaxID=449393 RepID=A0A6J6TXI6_9ZZZZ